MTLTVLMNAGPWLPVPPTGYGGIETVVATLVPRNHLLTDLLPLDEAPRLLTEVAEHRHHVLSAVFLPDTEGSTSSTPGGHRG